MEDVGKGSGTARGRLRRPVDYFVEGLVWVVGRGGGSKVMEWGRMVMVERVRSVEKRRGDG